MRNLKENLFDCFGEFDLPEFWRLGEADAVGRHGLGDFVRIAESLAFVGLAFVLVDYGEVRVIRCADSCRKRRKFFRESLRGG